MKQYKVTSTRPEFKRNTYACSPKSESSTALRHVIKPISQPHRNVRPSSLQDSASQFSSIGPSRSAQSIIARNNFLNGQPRSPKQQIHVPKDLNQIIRVLSQGNVGKGSQNSSQRSVQTAEVPFRVDAIIENHNISIQEGLSPGLYSAGPSQKLIPSVKQYLTSKKTIYKRYQQQLDQKLKVYDEALWKLIKQNDENELMDFDRRYYRSVRQRRLQKIIKSLLRKSRELQISLQDLIDNRMTQTKPYQQQGSYTFIHYIKKGVVDQIDRMLQQNPLYVHDFDEKQMTPLHIATARENFAVVNLLLSYNANILCKDMCGKTPLQLAIELENTEVVQLYLSIQCPSDVQYSNYCKLTKNQLILAALKKAKLNDILNRCQRQPKLSDFVSSMLRQIS